MAAIASLAEARFIDINTLDFPLTFNDIKSKTPNTFWGTDVTADELLLAGFALIIPTPKPEGDVVTEVEPELIDGQFHQTWQSRPYTLEEKKAILDQVKFDKLNTIESLKLQCLAKGYPYQFTPGVYYHIQMRDSDRTNILGLTEISARNPGVSQKFRTFENVTVILTSEELVTMSDAVGVAYSSLMESMWSFKDTIDSASDESQMSSIPGDLESLYSDHLNWPVVNS